MKRFLFFYFFIFLTLSYIHASKNDSLGVLEFRTENTVEKIKIDFTKVQKNVLFSSLIDEVLYIPLERTNTSLIGSPRKVMVNETNIYVLDPLTSRQVFVFNKDGTFKSLLGKSGQGPGTYNIPWDIYLDANDKTIEVLDGENMKINIYYSANGKYVKSIPLPHPSPAFAKIGQNYALYGHNEPNHLSIINKRGEILKTYIPNNKMRNLLLFSPFNPIGKEQSMFRMSGNNVIYSISENEATPYLVYDFGPYNFTKSYLATLPKSVQNNPHASIKNKVLRVDTHSENKSMIFFSFFLKEIRYIGLYDKGSKNVKLYRDIINDLTYKDDFYGLIFPEEHSDYFSGIVAPGHTNNELLNNYCKVKNTKSIFESFTEKNSNPLVYKVKFKRF